MQVRRIQKHGEFNWKHCPVFLSEVLYGQRVGLLPIDDRYYRVYFARVAIARFDTHQPQVERLWEEDRKTDD